MLLHLKPRIRELRFAVAVAIVSAGVASAAPAPAGASLITLGSDLTAPPNPPNHAACQHATQCAFGQTLLPQAGSRMTAPVDGTLVGWRALGSGTFFVTVLHPVGGGQFTVTTDGHGQGLTSYPTTFPVVGPLPIQAGDNVGVANAGSTIDYVSTASTPGAAAVYLEGSFPGTGSRLPAPFNSDAELLMNADMVASAATISRLAPSSGPATGGNTVTITGDHFIGTTAVAFGGTPAIDFNVVSNTAITATAPTEPAGQVDLGVTNGGGASAPTATSTYTFLPSGDAPSTPTSATPLGAGVTPVVASVTQSNSTWREGTRLVTFASAQTPVGTTFSFTLNAKAPVSFAFTQRLAGRQAKRRCLAPTDNNRHRPACRRTVTSGTLSFTGHNGRNEVFFQGRLSRSKKLKPGRYTLVITATNTVGRRSAPRSLSFTIVR